MAAAAAAAAAGGDGGGTEEEEAEEEEEEGSCAVDLATPRMAVAANGVGGDAATRDPYRCHRQHRRRHSPVRLGPG